MQIIILLTSYSNIAPASAFSTARVANARNRIGMIIVYMMTKNNDKYKKICKCAHTAPYNHLYNKINIYDYIQNFLFILILLLY